MRPGLGCLRLYTCLLTLVVLHELLFRPAAGSDDQARLLKDLFKNYNHLLRPVWNTTDTVNVSFAMTLGLLIYVNERDQEMKTNGYTALEWKDPQLMWDVGEYGGITAIRVPVDKVWIPDIVLVTNTDGRFGPRYKSNVVIYSHGSVNWLPPFIYRSACEIRVKNFPFDQQECVMRFSSWTYSANEVDIHPKQIVVDVTNYLRGGIWDLVDTSIHRVAYKKPEYSERTELTPRVDILVTIVIRRKTLFYTINLLIPTVLISFMTVFVFLLPTVAGEKVTLTISLTLSIVVFLLLVSKILPPAEKMPLISKFLLFIFIMNLISVFMTVITINLSYRGPKTHDMAWPLRIIFLRFFPKILLMKRPVVRAMTRRRTAKSAKAQLVLGESWYSVNAAQQQQPPRPNGSVRSNPTAGGGERATASRTGSRRDMAPIARVTETADVFWDEVDLSASAAVAAAASGPEPVSMHPDRIAVADSVEYIANHMEWNDGIKLIEEDWKFLALVVDRILLWIFFWVTCAGSISILFDSEYIFTHVDEGETVRRLTAQLI